MSEAITVREPTVLDKILDDVGALKTIPVETVTELHRIHRIEIEDRRMLDFGAAFKRAQERLSVIDIPKLTKGVHSSRFAKTETICRTLDPILTDEGFSWSFSDGDSPLSGHVKIVMRLRNSGHHETHDYNAPIGDGKGARGSDVSTPLMASGGMHTYAERRLRMSVFGLHLTDDDTDGAKLGGAKVITPDQVADLAAAIQESSAPLAGVLASQGVERLEDLTAAGRKGVLYTLEQRRRLRGGKS